MASMQVYKVEGREKGGLKIKTGELLAYRWYGNP